MNLPNEKVQSSHIESTLKKIRKQQIFVEHDLQSNKVKHHLIF